MKRFYLGALYMLFSMSKSYSQEINTGPRITALGNMGAALQDVWSLQSNQAGLTGLTRPVASVSYRSTYLNPEVSTSSAVIAYPFERNVVGLSLQKYGFSAYSEQRLSFSYAKRFGNTLSASLNFNVHQLKITQYGSARAYSVEAGLQYNVNERLTLGTHISNPNKSRFDAEIDAPIPVSLECGAAYRFSDKVLLNTGILKTIDLPMDLRLGLEYSIINWLDFRGGIALNPLRQFAGAGYQFNNLQIDLAASSHPVLGFSPQVALSYEF